MIFAATRERAKNPAILSEILDIVKALEAHGREPTFNTILNELSAKGVLFFHRSLRKYLDLLLVAKLLTVREGKTSQPNIRSKQVYHTVSRQNQPIVEAGEDALLLHGLNWDIPSPKSIRVKTDLQALARATLSGNKVYASLEDAIVQSLKVLAKRSPTRAPELVVFITALLATQKVDFGYLLNRARREGVEKELVRILTDIDSTLASSNPDVEDILTLYEIRKTYSRLRRPLLKAIKESQVEAKVLAKEIVRSNEVVEYAGKQLGLKG
jgi:hypothetical protein